MTTNSTMKQFFAIVLFTLISLGARAQDIITAYAVQLGTFSSANPADFVKVRDIGYLYMQDLNNGLSRVLMGPYISDVEAKDKLQKVKAQGFKDAFIQKIATTKDDAVFVVQMASYTKQKEVPWADWLRYTDKIAVQSHEGRVRICTGPFNTSAEAEAAAARLIKVGLKDPHVKRASFLLLHQATPFEMNLYETQSSLVARPDQASVTALQQVLTDEGYYKGKVDGNWGSTTKTALLQYKENDRLYMMAFHFADKVMQQTSPEVANPSNLQRGLNLIEVDAPSAIAVLVKEHHPMSYATQALMYASGVLESADKLKKTTDLMQQAIALARKTYKGPTHYDYAQPVDYSDENVLLGHYREVLMMSGNTVSVPCWVFNTFPVPAGTAFKPYWKSSKDAYTISGTCQSFAEVSEVKVIAVLSEVLLAKRGGKPGISSNELLTLYLAPHKPSLEESKEIRDGFNAYLEQLKLFKSTSATQQHVLNSLYVAIYDAVVKFDFHFMEQGFSAVEAHDLSLKVINKSLEPYFK